MSDNSTSGPRSRKAGRSRKHKSRKSTWSVKGFKVKRPYPDFPLSPHPSGKWQKRINGDIKYFGRWAHMVNGELQRVEGNGWQKALELYKAQADDLHAGRTPRVSANELKIMDLCNRFLTAKVRKVEAGEMGRRMLADYKETTDVLVDAFGNRKVDDLAADDFEKLRAVMAKRWGPTRLSNSITRVKSVFKYGVDNGLIERAVRFGSEFKKPGKSVLRRHRAKNGAKMLEAHELRGLLNAVTPSLKAMILLGLNSALGNADCANLPLQAIDLDRGWLDYPRAKTGIPRRCPLWSETVTALREVLAQRPKPEDEADADIVFLQANGRRWLRETEKSRRDNVSLHFRKLLKDVGIERPGLNFYTLRHVHRTIADGSRDLVACDIIMGHSDSSMASHYRERVDDERLEAVAAHVHDWLFAKKDPGQDEAPATIPMKRARA